MKTCHGLLLIWLALLSRVSAERPQTVVASIPSDVLLQNVDKDGGDAPLAAEGGFSAPMKNFEVTGFITKNGDIFELPSPRSMGSIEAREEPELEPGMSMCRYGNIVVYSDSDCNSFFSPSQLSSRPMKSQIQNDIESEEDDEVSKPVKKRNRVKGNKRKPNKNKKRQNKNRRNQQQRRKALKKQQNQRRRRNKLKNGGKRGNPQRKNKRRVNKNRNGNKVNKRRRINEGEERSDIEGAPLQFTILLNRH